MNRLIELLKANKEDILKPVAVLLAICIIIPLALSLANKITVNRIAELEKKNEAETMSGLISADSFNEKAIGLDGSENELTYYVAERGDTVLGYVFKTSAKGYGGEITVMTAVNTDGTVKAVAVSDASEETPGLGQNVTKESFYSQFTSLTGGISAVKNGADYSNNEINAVTGATISSKAVTRAVNEALENYNSVKEAEGLEEK